MNKNFYEYYLIQQNAPKQFWQFSIDTIDIKSKTKIRYIINFQIFGNSSKLYYCEFFPAIWEYHPDKLNKLLSRETGYVVNFRKIALTCFYIFHKYIIAKKNNNAVFVISGSLIKGEKLLSGMQISRKLKLYWKIITPYSRELGYRIIEILEYNAIALVRKENRLTDIEIQKEYSDFKTNNNNCP